MRVCVRPRPGSIGCVTIGSGSAAPRRRPPGGGSPNHGLRRSGASCVPFRIVFVLRIDWLAVLAHFVSCCGGITASTRDAELPRGRCGGTGGRRSPPCRRRGQQPSDEEQRDAGEHERSSCPGPLGLTGLNAGSTTLRRPPVSASFWFASICARNTLSASASTRSRRSVTARRSLRVLGLELDDPVRRRVAAARRRLLSPRFCSVADLLLELRELLLELRRDRPRSPARPRSRRRAEPPPARARASSCAAVTRSFARIDRRVLVGVLRERILELAVRGGQLVASLRDVRFGRDLLRRLRRRDANRRRGRLCCKSRKLQGRRFFREITKREASPFRTTSIALPKSPVSLM